MHESMSACEHECMSACDDHVNIFEAFWISISSSGHQGIDHQGIISIAMLTAVILSALVAASGGDAWGTNSVESNEETMKHNK